MGVGKMIWANVLIEEQQEPYIDDDEIEHNDIKRYIGKVKPEPYINDATCPICDSKVIPKCGSINVWHFAHESLKDCDTFSEGETEWHIDWKNEFPKEQQEITLEKKYLKVIGEKIMGADENEEIITEDEIWAFNIPEEQLNKCLEEHPEDIVIEKHRADIKINDLIMELQNSSISPKDIVKREEFYDNMIWIFNGENFANGLNLRSKDNIYTFRWKNPPKCLWYVKKPLNIDMNNGFVFQVKKIYPKCPCGGWGIMMEKEHLINDLKNGRIKN